MYRNRHGRGLKPVISTHAHPYKKFGAAQFDDLTLKAFASIEKNWKRELMHISIAVDDVPKILPLTTNKLNSDFWPEEVTADGIIPLAKFIPASLGPDGQFLTNRILLFRRPIEYRANSKTELLELIHDILAHQIAFYLNTDINTILSANQIDKG